MPRKSAKEEPETIAQRLGRIRRERGITQAEMAELQGISQPIVSDYERGELRLHGELIVKLAVILDCSADELLDIHEHRARSYGGNRWILRGLPQISLLSTGDQEALRRTIDAFLSKTGTASDFCQVYISVRTFDLKRNDATWKAMMNACISRSCFP